MCHAASDGVMSLPNSGVIACRLPKSEYAGELTCCDTVFIQSTYLSQGNSCADLLYLGHVPSGVFFAEYLIRQCRCLNLLADDIFDDAPPLFFEWVDVLSNYRISIDS